MNRQKVDSEMARSIGYDALTKTLEIEFKSNGAVWQYLKVPQKVFYEMISGSIGKYFMDHIRGFYPERQVR